MAVGRAPDQSRRLAGDLRCPLCNLLELSPMPADTTISKRDRALQRLRLGQIPDPARAHGAWVFLLLSVLAGSITSARGGFAMAILAGAGFGGVFLLASAAAIRGKPGCVKRATIGLILSALSPICALALQADPLFLSHGAVAILPAALSGYFAEKYGFQSALTLTFAVTALVVAAPATACAGGASPLRAWTLLLLLVPFFAWRTCAIRRRIGRGDVRGRTALKRQGMIEAGLAIVWTGLAVFIIHLL